MPRHYTKASLQYWNEEEFAAVIAAIASPRDLSIFSLAKRFGLRASEVGLLTIADVRLPARRIYVRRLKKGNSGEYPLGDGLALKALRRWIAKRGTSAGALFESRNHRPISRQRLDELTRHYGSRAGIPLDKQHFHCLRHTAGTLMAEKADLIQVQDWLGHRDPRSTARYVRVRPKRRIDLGEGAARDF